MTGDFFQPTVVVRQGADQILFGSVDGHVGLDLFLKVFGERVFFAGQERMHLRAEGVFDRIRADGFAAGVAGRTGRELCIDLIGCDLSWGGHFVFSFAFRK